MSEKPTLIERVLQEVAELPDRTSPEDWPEAMLVTADELRGIISSALEEARVASAPVTCSCGAVMVCPDIGCDQNKVWLDGAVHQQSAAPATAVPPDLHQQIMNLPTDPIPGEVDEKSYRIGFRDARHAAAELVSSPPPSASVDAAVTLPFAKAPSETIVTSRHGGNIGDTPFYLYPWQCDPEYDQGHSVIVWYDDLVLKQEDLDKALLRSAPSASGEGERQELRKSLTEVLDSLGLVEGATLQSIQRRLNVNTPTAMRLMALRYAALASASSGDAGTRAMPSVAQACRCPSPVGVPCPLSEQECAARIKANLASLKAGPA